MIIHPFSALHPAEGKAAQIASLPYDVMDTAEARRMAAGNPDSFLHIVRSEIDLPEATNPFDPAVYAKARENLQAMIADGRMVRDKERSLYLYRQVMNGNAQTAVVACCEAGDYRNGTILRHEKTRKDKEDDRTAHILATRAHTGQVFLCYRDRPQIDALVAAETAAPPLFDFTAEDGVRHVVWRVSGTAELLDAFKSVERAYIADGHHRSAASARAAEALEKEEGNLEGQRFMACLFPASQLRILPYHRSVRDLNGMSPQLFLRKLVEKGFAVSAVPGPGSLTGHSCAARLPDGWFRIGWSTTPAQDADPVARLDVARLQEDLLAPILGIGDPRTDSRIYFTGGIRGTGELERDVASGKAAVAFAMRESSIDDMIAIADAGATMPPKSTWFEPKLRSGLLVHEF